MVDTIRCQDFIRDKTIFNSELTDNSLAMKFLCNNNYQGITYNYSEKILLNNIGDLIKFNAIKYDNNGNLYYDLEVCRDCDIFGNIRVSSITNCNYKYTFIIGEIEVKPEYVELYAIASSIYNGFKIRITFREMPKEGDIIDITMNKYLFKTPERNVLLNSTITSDYFSLSKGVCNINKKIIV